MTTPSQPDTPPVAPTPAPSPASEHHGLLARIAHALLVAVDGSAHLLSDPTIVALLPPEYRGYAAAIGAIDRAVEQRATAGAGAT